MRDRVIWCDGKHVPWDDARVHVLSHSLQRGTLAFDYLGIHETSRGPALFRLAEHIDRLINTCHLIGLPLTYNRQELIDAVVETARLNPASTSVKISVLIPSIEVEIVPQDLRSSVFIAVYDYVADIIQKNSGKAHRANDLKLRIEKHKRNRREDIVPAQAKVAANYAFALATKIEARHQGFDDILLLDEFDEVAEAPTSNIFIVAPSGQLQTPPLLRVLNGITRDSVLKVARSLDIDCAERPLRVTDLMQAREAFLTASTLGCKTIGMFDDHRVGNGETGTLTRIIGERLNAAMRGERPEFDHWLIYLDD